MNKILSICIPTHNRSSYLQEALSNLIPEAKKFEIAIFVLDNHSTDDTSIVVNKLMKDYHNIFYKKQTSNVGLDKNMLDVINMSDTDYCWWLGDDDIIADNAFIEIMPLLKNNVKPDFILVNGVFISNDLKKKIKKQVFNLAQNTIYNDNVKFFEHYYNKIPFGNLIVNRKLFLKYNFDYKRFIDSSHAYAGAVFDYLSHHKKMKGSINIFVIAKHLVYLRGGQKSWSKQYAEIHFLHIPRYHHLLLDEYASTSENALQKYFKSGLSYIRIMYMVYIGQLMPDNYEFLTSKLPMNYKRKVHLVMKIPRFLINSLFFFITLIKKNLKYKPQKISKHFE